MSSEPVVIGRATLIYALDDATGRTRYIGKTTRALADRFGQHKRAARNGNLPVNRWLKKHPDATIRLIETVEPGIDWAAREQFWIVRGQDLLNLTVGGEGLAGHVFTSEHRTKIADALRTGDAFHCEICGTPFWRKRVEIKKGNCRFCSRNCYAASLKGVSRPVDPIATSRGVEAAATLRRARPDCKRGHPLSGDNLFITYQGSRGCKECRKIHKATYRGKSHG